MVALTVFQEKWEKGQQIIFSLASECLKVEKRPDLLHKRLEKDRGFLTHLAMTFSALVPLLKGFHLTLDQWRVNQEQDGWVRPEKEHGEEWMKVFYHQQKGQDNFVFDYLNSGAPLTIKPVSRFIEDLKGLTKILGAKVPPIIALRSVFLSTWSCMGSVMHLEKASGLPSRKTEIFPTESELGQRMKLMNLPTGANSQTSSNRLRMKRKGEG